MNFRRLFFELLGARAFTEFVINFHRFGKDKRIYPKIKYYIIYLGILSLSLSLENIIVHINKDKRRGLKNMPKKNWERERPFNYPNSMWLLRALISIFLLKMWMVNVCICVLTHTQRIWLMRFVTLVYINYFECCVFVL